MADIQDCGSIKCITLLPHEITEFYSVEHALIMLININFLKRYPVSFTLIVNHLFVHPVSLPDSLPSSFFLYRVIRLYECKVLFKLFETKCDFKNKVLFSMLHLLRPKSIHE